MLLRNYYSSLTYSAIGNANVVEDVAQELSPRYSRNIYGNYVLATFMPDFIRSQTAFVFRYGTRTSGVGNTIWFGKSTRPVTFNDYTVEGDHDLDLMSTQTNTTTEYDYSTKTYTNIRTYTITNTSNYNLPVNEILIGIGGGSSMVYGYIRELLNENSFIINANESVKFELTIKYTIAEPLQ